MDNLPKSRALAKKLGRTLYFTGKQCKFGHVAPRITAHGGCTACIKNRKPKYNRDYRARHIERLRAYDRQRPARPRTKEAVKREKKRHYEKYKAQILAKHRAYKRAHKKEYAEYFRKYKKENAGLVRFWNASREADIKLRTPSWLDEDDLWLMKEIYSLAALRTSILGTPWHVDHAIPLKGRLVSGLHVPSNLRVVPANVNLSKSNCWDVS